MYVRILFAIVFVLIPSLSYSSNIKEKMIREFAKDYPKVGKVYSNGLRSGNAFEISTAATFYIIDNKCKKSDYWLNELEIYPDEYNEFLGISYANGQCREQSFLLAYNHLSMCEKRSYTCKVNLLLMLADKEDYKEKAFNIANDLCQFKMGLAMNFVGNCYLRGYATVPNIDRAVFWYFLAIKYAASQEERDDSYAMVLKISKTMNAKKLKTIIAKAEQWTPTPDPSVKSTMVGSSYCIGMQQRR